MPSHAVAYQAPDDEEQAGDLAQDGVAVDVSVAYTQDWTWKGATYGGHGHHQEVHAVPVGQCILPLTGVGEIRWVATVLKLDTHK